MNDIIERVGCKRKIKFKEKQRKINRLFIFNFNKINRDSKNMFTGSVYKEIYKTRDKMLRTCLEFFFGFWLENDHIVIW